jgi:hypothetical protein
VLELAQVAARVPLFEAEDEALAALDRGGEGGS